LRIMESNHPVEFMRLSCNHLHFNAMLYPRLDLDQYLRPPTGPYICLMLLRHMVRIIFFSLSLKGLIAELILLPISYPKMMIRFVLHDKRAHGSIFYMTSHHDRFFDTFVNLKEKHNVFSLKR
jgi:hypothetical protein